VDTVRVDQGMVGDRIVARAVVAARGEVTHVSASIAGPVKRVLCREGDKVEAGQVLAELEGDEKILSPVQGVVLTRRVDAGDYAFTASQTVNTWLFEVSDLTQTELRVEVEEADAARVKAGLTARIVRLEERQPVLQGRVEHVSPRLEPRTIGAADARVRADGDVRALRVAWQGQPPAWPVGTRAEATLALEAQPAAARVPRSAITVRDGQAVVERPHLFWREEIPVEIVRADASYVEIRGVAPGTALVVPGDHDPPRVDADQALR
jgi:multidrug efflux pump subunit AcrA (membrane-fusion protein)